MNQGRIGLIMIITGPVLVVIGVVGSLGSGDDSEVTASPTSTPTFTQPTAATPVITQPTATTQLIETTATSTPATTTTTVAVETVDDFVELFAAAIAAANVDFLFDRLHPATLGGFGPDLCRNWIEQEILTLENYQLTSEVAGPRDQSFTTPAGTGTIENAYSADVSFSFQGQLINGGAGFALIDGVMHWLGQCR